MRLASLVAFLAVCACSFSPQVAGNADVTGQVLQSSGQPFANSSVVIDCGPGGPTKTVSTDAGGRYATNLSAPAAGRSPCVFGVPNLQTPRIRVDSAIGFVPVGQFNPLQLILLLDAV